MNIDFTRAQLKELTNNGITEDDLRATVDEYRNQGRSDEQIRDALWAYVKQINPHVLTPVELEEKEKRLYPGAVERNKKAGLAIPEYADNISYSERNEDLDNKYNEYRKKKYEREQKFWDTLGSGATAVYSTLNASLGGVPGYIIGETSEEDRQTLKDMKEKYSGEMLTGEVLSVFTPTGFVSKGAKGVNVAANAVQKTIQKGGSWAAKKAPGKAANAITKTSNALGWTGKLATNAVGNQAINTYLQTMEGLAETGEFDRGMEAVNNFGNDSLTNAAVDVAMQGLGGIGSKIKNVFSKTQKAVNAAGGVENLAKAQEKSLAVINAGGTPEEAASAFYASITENLGREARSNFEKLLANDEEFAKIMQKQAAGAKQVVIDTVDAVTSAEYGKLSQKVLENAWGTAKNTLGKNEVDFTKNGLKQLLGLDNAGTVMEARKQALARAENRVMYNPSLARDVKVNFDDLTASLKKNGSQDLEKAYKSVEPGSLKSFEGSKEQTDAIVRGQQRIENTEKAIGRPLNSGEIEQIMQQEERIGAERHFRNIMAEGTDSVMDINDIKDFFDKTFAKEVAEGQAEAIGAFTQGVNAQILDNLDPILYQSNQAMRVGNELEKIHDFGKRYTNANFNELESLLNNGVSAEEKAMKLSVFKMGMLDKMSEMAVSGNPSALEDMRQMMLHGKAKQYFSTEEVGAYIDKIKPKAEAARTLNGILNFSYRLRGENIDMLAPMIRAGVSGAVLHSPNTTINSIITVASRTQTYGPKTAKTLQMLAENPDWKTFNKLVKEVTDPAEKNKLRQAITLGLEMTINQNNMDSRMMNDTSNPQDVLDIGGW